MKPPVFIRLLPKAAGVCWAGIVASSCFNEADEPARATIVNQQGATPTYKRLVTN